MQVLSVVSEIFPLLKTGGLADVAAALPRALIQEGIAVRSLLPGYPAVLGAPHAFEAVYEDKDLFGGPARVLAGTVSGLDLFVLDAPHLFLRPGGPYSDSMGCDWIDNAQRFGALAWSAAAIGRGVIPAFVPDVVHAHDWQAGLMPAYLHQTGSPRPATLLTVHNLAHQGLFSAELLSGLRLSSSLFSTEGIEFHGAIGFLKAGLFFADHITTVSPTYAAEIGTPEGGMGLDGLLRTRTAALSGILNGIDERVWNPSCDAHIAASFDETHLARRVLNKIALQNRLNVNIDPAALLFGVVSRLTWQKGLDLLLESLPVLLRNHAQLVILGTGDAVLEKAFTAAAANYGGRVGVAFEYDEALAHLIQAGSDALIVPSRFEPCGLTQLSALRYGCVPVVARVGGLADTVIDANEMALAAGVATGFQFSPITRTKLEVAIDRVHALWPERKAWERLQINGMRSDVGWKRPAKRYAELYRNLKAN
jgi:starch synthase